MASVAILAGGERTRSPEKVGVQFTRVAGEAADKTDAAFRTARGRLGARGALKQLTARAAHEMGKEGSALPHILSYRAALQKADGTDEAAIEAALADEAFVATNTALLSRFGLTAETDDAAAAAAGASTTALRRFFPVLNLLTKIDADMQSLETVPPPEKTNAFTALIAFIKKGEKTGALRTAENGEIYFEERPTHLHHPLFADEAAFQAVNNRLVALHNALYPEKSPFLETISKTTPVPMDAPATRLTFARSLLPDLLLHAPRLEKIRTRDARELIAQAGAGREFLGNIISRLVSSYKSTISKQTLTPRAKRAIKQIYYRIALLAIQQHYKRVPKSHHVTPPPFDPEQRFDVLFAPFISSVMARQCGDDRSIRFTLATLKPDQNAAELVPLAQKACDPEKNVDLPLLVACSTHVTPAVMEAGLETLLTQVFDHEPTARIVPEEGSAAAASGGGESIEETATARVRERGSALHAALTERRAELEERAAAESEDVETMLDKAYADGVFELIEEISQEYPRDPSVTALNLIFWPARDTFMTDGFDPLYTDAVRRLQRTQPPPPRILTSLDAYPAEHRTLLGPFLTASEELQVALRRAPSEYEKKTLVAAFLKRWVPSLAKRRANPLAMTLLAAFLPACAKHHKDRMVDGVAQAYTASDMYRAAKEPGAPLLPEKFAEYCATSFAAPRSRVTRPSFQVLGYHSRPNIVGQLLDGAERSISERAEDEHETRYPTDTMVGPMFYMTQFIGDRASTHAAKHAAVATHMPNKLVHMIIGQHALPLDVYETFFEEDTPSWVPLLPAERQPEYVALRDRFRTEHATLLASQDATLKTAEEASYSARVEKRETLFAMKSEHQAKVERFGEERAPIIKAFLRECVDGPFRDTGDKQTFLQQILPYGQAPTYDLRGGGPLAADGTKFTIDPSVTNELDLIEALMGIKNAATKPNPGREVAADLKLLLDTMNDPSKASLVERHECGSALQEAVCLFDSDVQDDIKLQIWYELGSPDTGGTDIAGPKLADETASPLVRKAIEKTLSMPRPFFPPGMSVKDKLEHMSRFSLPADRVLYLAMAFENDGSLDIEAHKEQLRTLFRRMSPAQRSRLGGTIYHLDGERSTNPSFGDDTFLADPLGDLPRLAATRMRGTPL